MKRIARNALILSAGGLFSQLIPLAVAPVLTRLYSPEAFGLFSTFFSLAAVVAIPATLRLELAVVLDENDQNASRLAVWIMVLSSLSLLLLEVFLLIADSWLVPLKNLHALGGLLLLVPLMAWLMALQGVLMIITNRRRAYKTAAICGVIQQSFAALVAVILGFAGAQATALIASRLGAFVAGCLTMLGYGSSGFFSRIELHWDDARAFLKRYYQFPLYNVPYSISGVLSRDFPVIALSSSGYLAVAGQFAIARMAASVPGAFLTSSLSNMFYREAAEFLDAPHFSDVVWKLFKSIALIVFPVFMALGLTAGEIFPFVFGQRWHGSGAVFGYLAIPFALTALTGWPERVFEVRAKQQWSFAIQLCFDGLTIAGVLLVLTKGGPPLHAVQVYAAIQTCYQLTYLASVFILAGLGWRRFLSLLAGIVLIAAGFFAAASLMRQWDASGQLFYCFVLVTLALMIALQGVYQLLAMLRRRVVAN